MAKDGKEFLSSEKETGDNRDTEIQFFLCQWEG
jgi:hypothetical protein